MEQLVRAGQLALVQSNATAGQPVTLSAYRLDDGSPAWQIFLPSWLTFLARLRLRHHLDRTAP